MHRHLKAGIIILFLTLTHWLSNGPIPAFGNASTPVMIAFSRNASDQPRYTTFNGAAWSASAAMPDIGGEAQWVVLKNCPTRNELAFAALDENNDVNVCRFNGSSWSHMGEVCSNTSQYADRCMALEYEHLSGDFLLVYWKQSGTDLAYRTYNGSTLAAEATLALPNNDKIRFASLTQKPYSNELMLLAMNDGGDLFAAAWNGSGFGSVTTIETNMKSDGFECFAGAYETISGDFILVYSEAGQHTPRYRIYSCSTWTAESSLPTVGATINWIRLAPDPLTDQMLFASLDTGDDLNANIWNGSAWGTNQELEATVGTSSIRKFDMAYLGGTSLGVIFYGEGILNSGRYRYWMGGWSAENSLMDQGEKPTFMAGFTSQTVNQVYMVAGDEGADLSVAWSTGMTYATLETDLGGSVSSEPFMLSTPGLSPPTPANTPYATDFQGAVGAEWTATTSTTNATYSKFLGRFYRDKVRLALNTTPGQTYTLSFDLYTIDSWDGNHATWGPDDFVVKADCAEIFRKSFVHETLTNDQSYPYPYDQAGNYAFNASYQDGMFRCVEAVFTATHPTTLLTFSADFVDSPSSIDNESWGIDNVSVKAATFVDASATTGFNAQTTTSEQDGSGLHWADLDNDGDLDALLTGGSSARLMIGNVGSGTFSASTFGGGAIREQGALADYDNDGDLDFWSCEAGADGTQALFTNNGAGVFANSGASGFAGAVTNEGCAAGDLDHDGWPDIVVFSENSNWIGDNQRTTTASFSASNSSTLGLNGSGNFGPRGYCASGDVNNDGYLDFFYRYNNGRLFLSDGDGTYTQNARGISVLTGGYEDTAAAWADYDNDGDLDLFVPRTTAGYTASLWRDDVNWTTSAGSFSDVSSSAGLTLNANPACPSNIGTRSGCWGDYDNDGDLDLFIVGANGNCMLYRNQGGGVLARFCAGAVVSSGAHDATFVDFDNDGDLDLAVTCQSAPTVLFRNLTNNSNYLKVRLVGVGAGGTDQFGQGTRIELWNSAGTTLLARRDIGVARGYGGSEPFWAHFGGVTASTAYKLKVYFQSKPIAEPYEVTVTPNAVSTAIGAVTIPQMITITEPEPNKKIMLWAEVRN
ncbi:MAG TPA: VCBS repeat-containing protein [Phycisphaerae bacterium]|nr:VCBS repeat-containing protein [Phycisphaerae bacterium]